LPSDRPRELSNDVVLKVVEHHKIVLEKEALDDIDSVAEFATHPEQIIESEIRKRLPLDSAGAGTYADHRTPALLSRSQPSSSSSDLSGSAVAHGQRNTPRASQGMIPNASEFTIDNGTFSQVETNITINFVSENSNERVTVQQGGSGIRRPDRTPVVGLPRKQKMGVIKNYAV